MCNARLEDQFVTLQTSQERRHIGRGGQTHVSCELLGGNTLDKTHTSTHTRTVEPVVCVRCCMCVRASLTTFCCEIAFRSGYRQIVSDTLHCTLEPLCRHLRVGYW